MPRLYALLGAFLLIIGLLSPRGGYGSAPAHTSFASATGPSTPGAVMIYKPAVDTTETDTTDSGGMGQLERKSPTRALAYSLGGTAALAPVFGIGLVVGPSFGHYYADNQFQANLGIGIRLLGGGAAVVGAAGSALGATEEVFGDGNQDVDAETFGLIGGIGGGIVLISAVVDIVMAPFAAQDYNEAHELEVRVHPTAGPGPDQAGLALEVKF